MAAVARGLAESGQALDILDSVLASPLFRRTGRLTRMPVANQVLLRRPGYRDLVRIHQQTQLASTLTWDGAGLVFHSGQRDVATLFEYWVFLHIARVVADICGQTFDYARLYDLSGERTAASLEKGTRTRCSRSSATRWNDTARWSLVQPAVSWRNWRVLEPRHASRSIARYRPLR